MQKNDPEPAALIQKDNLRLAVTNVYPSFQKKTELQSRQEISAKLYQIFKKYAER